MTSITTVVLENGETRIVADELTDLARIAAQAAQATATEQAALATSNGAAQVALAEAQVAIAGDKATLAGLYANADAFAEIPGGVPGWLSGRHWADRGNAMANAEADEDIPGFPAGSRSSKFWRNETASLVAITMAIVGTNAVEVANFNQGEREVATGNSFFVMRDGGIKRWLKAAGLNRNTPDFEFQGPVEPIPQLLPGASWNGTAASGFAVVPADPARTTAKPILRMVTAPLVTFGGSYREDTLVGAMAVANNGGTLIGGIARVRFHFEGRTVDVTTPTFRTFTRRDGTTYQQLGYWVTLKKPAGIEGEARLYVEAIPTNTAMQNRVIGPFRYFLYNTEFTHQVTLNPAAPVVAGSNYQDIFSALNYLRSQSALRSRILGYGATHTVPDSALFSSLYVTGQSCVVEWNEPVVISQTDALKGEFRTRWGGMIFRGENLTFDMRNISRFTQEATGYPAIFERVRFTNSGGRGALWNKGFRPQGSLLGTTDFRGSWLLDCAFDQTLNSAMSELNLARGCILEDVGMDAFTLARCVVNCRVDDMDSTALRQEIDAMTVVGPAGATLSLSGVSDANGRVFTARVGGSTVGTFTVNNTQAAVTANTNWEVSHVVAWINGLGAGWSATTLDETRRATALSQKDTTGNAFSNLDVSTVKTLVTQLDAHADWYALISGTVENVLVMDNISTQLGPAQILLLATASMNDAAFINNAWSYKIELLDGSQFSQFSSPQSHVVCVHNTCPDQNWVIRITGGVAGVNYLGDAYCLFANNVLRDGGHVGGSPTAEVVKGQHYLTGAGGFTSETGDTTGGTRNDLFANIGTGDFRPAGALLTNQKPALWPWDAYGDRRATNAPAGAVA